VQIACGWLLVGAVVVVTLARIGDPPAAVVAFLLVWLTCTTLPGVLVWRSLARRSSLVQELGFGSVLGIGLLLLAWLPAILLHRPLLMWLWPIGVVILFAAAPPLRRHWRPERSLETTTPARWHLAMMSVFVIGLLRLVLTRLVQQPLPPHATNIFQDVWYELSLTQRLAHSVTIGDPEVAGVPLVYHWFSNAQASATASLSGVPSYEVILHLWPVPMLFTLALAVAAATERILEGPHGSAPNRRWWAGPLAAFLAAGLPVALFLSQPQIPGIDNGFVVSSTSGILAMTVVLALVGPVLDLLRGRASPGTWALVLLLLVLSAGTKPSILPVVACGSALTGLVEWARTRAFPRVAAILTVVPVVLIPLAALTVMGSTSGSRLQLFETLSLDPAFQRAAGATVGLPGHGGWIAPGIAAEPARMWPLVAGLLALYVLTELPRLLGILGVADPTLRRDPGTWWCTGVVASGFCGLWVLAHPGYSQHYFWRIVIGLAIALTVATAVRLVPPVVRAKQLLPAVSVTCLVGICVGLSVVLVGSGRDVGVARRLLPYGAAAVVLAVLLAAMRRWRAHDPTRRAGLPALTVVVAFCFAAGIPAALGITAPAGNDSTDASAADAATVRYTSEAEQRAALWLGEHSGPDDIIATNVFCSPPRYRPGCRHVSFWVSALTGRQLLIGGWAYTAENLTEYGHGSQTYQQHRSPWPSTVGLSLAAVRDPNPRVFAALRHRGVRWIFADRRATAVSSRLDRYATPRYANSEVRIYEIALPVRRRGS
jgi:hypothetical protein